MHTPLASTVVPAGVLGNILLGIIMFVMLNVVGAVCLHRKQKKRMVGAIVRKLSCGRIDKCLLLTLIL